MGWGWGMPIKYNGTGWNEKGDRIIQWGLDKWKNMNINGINEIETKPNKIKWIQ